MLVVKCSVCNCEFLYQSDESEGAPEKPAVIKFIGSDGNSLPDAGSGKSGITPNTPEDTKTLIYLRCPNGHMRPYWAFLGDKTETVKIGPFGLFAKKIKTSFISKIVSIPLVKPDTDNTKADSVEMVDDYFWLGDMKSCLKDVWNVQKTAAEKLVTFVTWLWSSYTTVFVGSAIIFSEQLNGLPSYLFILMITPVLLLPFAYYFCVRAQMPREESIIDYRMPEFIEKSNLKLIYKKSKSFRHAGSVTFLSIIAFVAAILSYIYFQSTQSRIEAFLDKDKSEIIVTGNVPSGFVMSVSVESWMKNKTGKRDTTISYINQGGGAFNLYFPLKDSSSEYSVLVFWKKKDREMSYAKLLKK
ncbi:MAG: hypothetical protein LWX07_00915 [Bacteroidetes bacterium]|nr:hypothetical protein [Bacteroidota bacterium]